MSNFVVFMIIFDLFLLLYAFKCKKYKTVSYWIRSEWFEVTNDEFFHFQFKVNMLQVMIIGFLIALSILLRLDKLFLILFLLVWNGFNIGIKQIVIKRDYGKEV